MIVIHEPVARAAAGAGPVSYIACRQRKRGPTRSASLRVYAPVSVRPADVELQTNKTLTVLALHILSHGYKMTDAQDPNRSKASNLTQRPRQNKFHMAARLVQDRSARSFTSGGEHPG